MIQATKALLEKLRDALLNQANTLPEISFFGTENDIEGIKETAKFVQWVADNFDDKKALTDKREEIDDKLMKHQTVVEEERLFMHEEILDWVDGKHDTVYSDNVGDDE